MVRGFHDRHFPWCEKYKAGESCAEPLDTEVAKAEVERCVVTTLKKRLLMYGASVSGKKEILVERLISHVNSAPPELGIGSFFHFNKKETAAKFEQCCKENYIMVESGYVHGCACVCICARATPHPTHVVCTTTHT